MSISFVCHKTETSEKNVQKREISKRQANFLASYVYEDVASCGKNIKKASNQFSHKVQPFKV